MANVEVNGTHYCVEHEHEGPLPCPRCADATARVAFGVRPAAEALDALATNAARLMRERDDARAQVAKLDQAVVLAVRTGGAVAAERDALHTALRGLLVALPRCALCDATATRAWGRGDSPRYCDAHGTNAGTLRVDVPETTLATAVRAARKALGEG